MHPEMDRQPVDGRWLRDEIVPSQAIQVPEGPGDRHYLYRRVGTIQVLFLSVLLVCSENQTADNYLIEFARQK